MPAYAFANPSPTITIIRHEHTPCAISKTDLAMEILVELLEFGAVPVADIETVMIGNGINQATT